MKLELFIGLGAGGNNFVVSPTDNSCNHPTLYSGKYFRLSRGRPGFNSRPRNFFLAISNDTYLRLYYIRMFAALI